MPQDDVRPAPPELTELQLKCLEAFWNRRPIKQIAADLGISEGWVNTNLQLARRQLNVTSSAEAAAVVFGGKRGSIKNYYSQKTTLPETSSPGDRTGAGSDEASFALAASERALINRYGPLATLGGILAVAVASIVGVTLLIDAAQGMYQLLKAFGH